MSIHYTASATAPDHVLIKLPESEHGLTIEAAEKLASSLAVALSNARRLSVKPCPFCGADRSPFLKLEWERNDAWEGHRVICGKCGCKGPHHSDEKAAIQFWNNAKR